MNCTLKQTKFFLVIQWMSIMSLKASEKMKCKTRCNGWNLLSRHFKGPVRSIAVNLGHSGLHYEVMGYRVSSCLKNLNSNKAKQDMKMQLSLFCHNLSHHPGQSVGEVLSIPSERLKEMVWELSWWLRPIILALRRLRQKDLELEISLGYTETPVYEKEIIKQYKQN